MIVFFVIATLTMSFKILIELVQSLLTDYTFLSLLSHLLISIISIHNLRHLSLLSPFLTLSPAPRSFHLFSVFHFFAVLTPRITFIIFHHLFHLIFYSYFISFLLEGSWVCQIPPRQPTIHLC